MEKASGIIRKIRPFFNTQPLAQPEQSYLLGVRGFVVIQSFIWVFLTTFVPATVKDSSNTSGPVAYLLLRKTLSVLFWNEMLLYSTIILLSARMICLPFLATPSRSVLASSVFRRGIRLGIPVAVGLGIVHLVFFAQPGSLPTEYIGRFKRVTNNTSIIEPYALPSTGAYWNAVFEVFWVTRQFNRQAASRAFPSQTLWLISAVFQQAYTVYVTMVIIPYTQCAWRVVGGISMILTAWWVQSWAWYSITGLLLADAVLHMDLVQKSRAGIPLGRWLGIKRRARKGRLMYGLEKEEGGEVAVEEVGAVIPTWCVYTLLCSIGLVLQYLWTAYRPDLENAELWIHAGEYQHRASGLDIAYSSGQPQARIDNYLFLLGAFLFLDTTLWLQRIFEISFFLYLGRRSLSFFLMQSIIIYTAGIKLFLHLEAHTSSAGTVTVCLFVCIPLTLVAAEIFYRLVEQPTQKFSHFLWEWIITP